MTTNTIKWYKMMLSLLEVLCLVKVIQRHISTESMPYRPNTLFYTFRRRLKLVLSNRFTTHLRKTIDNIINSLRFKLIIGQEKSGALLLVRRGVLGRCFWNLPIAILLPTR